MAELAPGARIGRRIEAFDSVDSTMRLLADRTRAGAPEGSVVLADHQRAGRGRLSRRWLAPPGTALMLSLLFRPGPSGLPVAGWSRLSMLLSLAALDVIEPRLPPGATAQLKWPNDILAGGGKLAGLLAEADWQAGQPAPDWVILGIGINLRQDAEQLPDGAVSLASLHRATGQAADPARLDRCEMAAELLAATDRRHRELLSGRDPLAEWASQLATLGRRVVARRGDERLSGRAESVGEDGSLQLRLDDGRLEVLQAGDVTLAAS